MGKKIVAATNIRHDGEEIAAGSEVDASKFTKDQLKALYDSGAVTVEDGSDEEKVGPDTEAPAEPTEPTDENKAAENPEAPVTAPPTKATATKATSTDKK